VASPEAMLVPLLYRADWTTWSFSTVASIRMRRAATTGDYRLLVAPGGRYRAEPLREPDDRPTVRDDDEPVSLIVCDGEFRWEVRGPEVSRSPAWWDERPLERILHPAWLVAGYQLRVTGAAEYAGRRVHVVEGARRAWPLAFPRRPPSASVSGLIDAETGLVLRYEVTADRQLLEGVELRDFVVQPPPEPDAADFSPPTGVELEECDEEDELDADDVAENDGQSMSGPAWTALKLAAQAAERAVKRHAEADQQPDPDPGRLRRRGPAWHPGRRIGGRLVARSGLAGPSAGRGRGGRRHRARHGIGRVLAG
jgi:hypothetical protein